MVRMSVRRRASTQISIAPSSRCSDGVDHRQFDREAYRVSNNKRQQTMAKITRERAVKEKRERKLEKKRVAALERKERAAGIPQRPPDEDPTA